MVKSKGEVGFTIVVPFDGTRNARPLVCNSLSTASSSGVAITADHFRRYTQAWLMGVFLPGELHHHEQATNRPLAGLSLARNGLFAWGFTEFADAERAWNVVRNRPSSRPVCYAPPETVTVGTRREPATAMVCARVTKSRCWWRVEQRSGYDNAATAFTASRRAAAGRNGIAANLGDGDADVSHPAHIAARLINPR